MWRRGSADVLRAAGKEPVIVDKEVPGFIGNRLQYAILREAWALWAEGAASAEAHRHGGEGVPRAAARDHGAHRVGRRGRPRYAARLRRVPHPAPDDGVPASLGGDRAGGCGASRPALGPGRVRLERARRRGAARGNARRSCSVTSPATRPGADRRPTPRIRVVDRANLPSRPAAPRRDSEDNGLGSPSRKRLQCRSPARGGPRCDNLGGGYAMSIGQDSAGR